MSRGINWDKVRRNRIVWEKGGIPVWQDGWGPGCKNETSGAKTNEKFSALESLESENGPLTLSIRFSSPRNPRTVSFIYEFHAFHPGDCPTITRRIDEFWTSNRVTWFEQFTGYLHLRYAIADSHIEDGPEKREWYFALRPRKLRHGKSRVSERQG